jgi:chemotaxis protein MotB
MKQWNLLSQSTDYSPDRERAKSGWMLSFADLITLLITFFIMMLSMDKGQVTHLENWLEGELDNVYQELKEELGDNPSFSIARTAIGVEIGIKGDNAFKSGGVTPSQKIETDLKRLSQALNRLAFFKRK